MYMGEVFSLQNVENTYQNVNAWFGMYFDRDFVGKLDCNTYQIKNVQFGMYMRGNFG